MLMMSNNLQHFVFTIINQPAGVSFLNIRPKSNFDYVVYSSADATLVQYLSSVFLFADFILYIGVILVIVILGTYYNKFSTQILTVKLFKISGGFIYLSLLINLIGFYNGFEFLNYSSVLVFDSSYTFTMFSQIFKCLVLAVLGCMYALSPYIVSSSMRLVELPLLLQIAAALCVTALSSANLALLLLCLEGFSLLLYIMTALGRTYGGITASVKYFAFGTLGSIFLFWSAVNFYSTLASLSYEAIAAVLNKSYLESESFSKSLDFAGNAFVVGFMLKLGAAPTHQWVADVYSGVSMYVTAFFSIFVKFVLFVIFLPIALKFNYDSILNQFIVLSIVIGCFMSVNQTEIKRLLAYSSILHAAFLFMGDAESSLLYLLTYVITSLVLFSVLLSVEVGGVELIYLNDVRYIRNSGYFNVFCMVVSLASAAGLPPFAGFYGKFLIWSSLVEDIYLSDSTFSYFVLFLSIAVSLITIYYYMRLVAYMFIGQDLQPRSAFVIAELGQDFYNILFSVQGLLCVLVVFWTFIQPYACSILQLALISL